MILPKAKTENIVVQETGSELLLYDLKTNQAFLLNSTSAIIYQACDGNTDFDELRRKHRLTDEIIYFALDALKESSLVEDYQSNYFAGWSRREVIRRVGLASMTVLPTISSIVAPKSINAASSLLPNSAACVDQSQCQSNFCLNGSCCAAFAQPCTQESDCCTSPSVTCGFGSCLLQRGRFCLDNSDCASNVCQGLLCA